MKFQHSIFYNWFHISRVEGQSKRKASLIENKSWDGWNPIWSRLIPVRELFKKHALPLGSMWDSLGVYVMIYIPTGDVKYVGNGVVWKRKDNHTDAVEILSSNKDKSNLSSCGKKMFNFDKNVNNWGFRFCVLDNKDMAKDYEDVIRRSFNPPFNVQRMMNT
jgi:hypothetical protein